MGRDAKRCAAASSVESAIGARVQSDERSRSDAVQRVHGGQNVVVCECVFDQGDCDELCCACEE